MKEQSSIWKILAIIFISLFVIESIFLVWIFKIGYNYIEKDDKCYTICSMDEDYSSYWYENNLCYCVNQEREFILQQI